MTLQAEWPTGKVAASPTPRTWSPAALAAVLSIVLLAAGVLVGVVASKSHNLATRPPKAVLGQPLLPLAVYGVVLGADPTKVHKDEKAVPEMGRLGHSTVLKATPVIDLHVRYAHVRPVRGHWQIEFLAPEAATFNVHTTQGKFFDVLIGGKALTLFFVVGSSDGTNFGIGAGANWLSQEQATAVARTLTSSVSVAHCSNSAIDANECS